MTTKIDRSNVQFDRRKEMTDYLDALLANVMKGITHNNDIIKRCTELLKGLHNEFQMIKRVRKEVRKE